KPTEPAPVTKTANVGVALASICVVTEGPGAALHCPVAGTVSQTLILTGKLAPPVSAEAVMEAPSPTLTVATAKNPVPVLPGMLPMPSLLTVAASATMSGTGVGAPEISSVLMPTSVVTGFVLLPAKLNGKSTGAMGADGVSEIT